MISWKMLDQAINQDLTSGITQDAIPDVINKHIQHFNNLNLLIDSGLEHCV